MCIKQKNIMGKDQFSMLEKKIKTILLVMSKE